jgi:transcriptional regulator with XRE-family HTH domain
MTTIEKAFGLALKELRLEKGLSQEALATSSGLHRTYISLLERGIKSPSLTTLDRLSQALGVSLGQFINSIEKFTTKNKRAS